MQIGVIGLGLIGGSMAKSIKRRTLHDVFGFDLDRETMMLSRMSGAMDKELTDENIGECDIIFLAIRPEAAGVWVEENAKKIAKSTVVVDLCGIKRSVCDKIAPLAKENGFSFIGGHPMAGKERSGFVNSSDDLFVGASMILTPDGKTDLHILEMLKAFFIDVGFSSVTFSNPDEHDKIIAYTSQLAHITSSAYVKSPTAQKRRGFSGGSFQDMTRVARLDENMWTELFLNNADNLADELETFITNLTDYLDAIKAKDAETLTKLLKEGRLMKAAAGGN